MAQKILYQDFRNIVEEKPDGYIKINFRTPFGWSYITTKLSLEQAFLEGYIK